MLKLYTFLPFGPIQPSMCYHDGFLSLGIVSSVSSNVLDKNYLVKMFQHGPRAVYNQKSTLFQFNAKTAHLVS